MKDKKTILWVTAVFLVTSAFAQAQTGNITGLCQQIPGLTEQQSQKINKLNATHQKAMDELRTAFWSEPDLDKAYDLKSQMNAERVNHYNDLTALLTPQQKNWFERKCYAGTGGFSGRRYAAVQGALSRNADTTGRGNVPARAYPFCRAWGRGWRAGYGRGFGPGYGRGYGRGFAPGYELGPGLGRGRGFSRGAWIR